MKRGLIEELRECSESPETKVLYISPESQYLVNAVGQAFTRRNGNIYEEADLNTLPKQEQMVLGSFKGHVRQIARRLSWCLDGRPNKKVKKLVASLNRFDRLTYLNPTTAVLGDNTPQPLFLEGITIAKEASSAKDDLNWVAIIAIIAIVLATILVFWSSLVAFNVIKPTW